MSVKTSKC